MRARVSTPHSIAVRLLLVGVAAICTGFVVPAHAQTPPAAAPAPVDPQVAAAQKAFEALPEADRKAIQDNLIWSGDFSGAGTGGFGPLTYRAILAFQARQKVKADGILQPADRAALEAQASRARDTVKFARVLDARTGSRIGVPQKLLDRPRSGASGTIFANVDNSVVLETQVAKGELQALYDATRADGPGRKVTYKVIRPDWFVVAGDADGRRFYTRYTVTPAGLRGYTLTYPTARAAEFDRISIAIANTFDPAPAAAVAAAPAAAAPAGPGLSPSPALPAAPAAPAAPVIFVTGVVVAPGKVVAPAAVEACTAVVVSRQPATVATLDKARGFALLDAPAARTARPLPASTAMPADGADLVVVGFSQTGADATLSMAPGEARAPAGGALRVFAPLQRGSAGSAVFDRSGGFVGVVASLAAPPRLVAGIVPQASWPVISATTLAEAGIAFAPAATAPRTAGEIAASVRPQVVTVECAR